MWIEPITIIHSSSPLIGSQTQAKAHCHGALLWQLILVQEDGSNLGWPNEIEGKAFLSIFGSGLLFLFHWRWTSNSTALVAANSYLASRGAIAKSRKWLIDQDQSPGWIAPGGLFPHWTMWHNTFPNCLSHFHSGSLSLTTQSILKPDTVLSKYFICIISFYPHTTLEEVVLLSPSYRWKNGMRKLSNLLGVSYWIPSSVSKIHILGENTCKRSNWQRINLQNIQAALAAQYQKKPQKTQSKSGRKT